MKEEILTKKTIRTALILSAEHRAAVESTLTAVTEANSTLSAKLAALESARQVHAALLADAEHLCNSTDPADPAGVTRLVGVERGAELQGGRIPLLEAGVVQARQTVAAAMTSVPELLRGILAPVFDSLVEDMTHEFLPTFKDAGLARNAALQSAAVRKFYSFLTCYWAVDRNVQTAPAALVWLQNLLDGALPKEIE